jgi:hypothetical protein
MAAKKSFLVNEILPGSSLRYALSFSGLASYGHLRIEVSVVGRGVRASRATTIWTVPWALLALVVLVIALVAWLAVSWLRKRRARVNPREGQLAEPVDV